MAERRLSGGLCDLSGLIRDVLEELRARTSPTARALFLVRLFPELPCDARGQLAVALATRLRADELAGLARAGLLAIDDACALVEAEWRDTVRAQLAPALAARAAPRLHDGVLVCAEGVTAALTAQAGRALVASTTTMVVFIASAADSTVSAEEAADLLAAEARLSDDAALAHFAALAVAGRLKVIPEASLAPPPSRWRRVVSALVAAARVQWYGAEAPPARRPAWSIVTT